MDPPIGSPWTHWGPPGGPQGGALGLPLGTAAYMSVFLLACSVVPGEGAVLTMGPWDHGPSSCTRSVHPLSTPGSPGGPTASPWPLYRGSKGPRVQGPPNGSKGILWEGPRSPPGIPWGSYGIHPRDPWVPLWDPIVPPGDPWVPPRVPWVPPQGSLGPPRDPWGDHHTPQGSLE